METYMGDNLLKATFFRPPFFKITDVSFLVAFMSPLNTEINWHPASNIGTTSASFFFATFLLCVGFDTADSKNCKYTGALFFSSSWTTSHENLARSSGDDSLNTDGFALEQSPTSSEVISLQVNFSTSLFALVIAKNSLDMETMSPKASCLPILSKVSLSLSTTDGLFGYCMTT